MERASDESTSPPDLSSAPKVSSKPANSILKSGLAKIKRKRFPLSKLVVCICMTLCICSESNDNNTGATTNKKRQTEGNYIISYCCHFVCNCAEYHMNSSVDITTSKPVAIRSYQ